MRMMFGRFVCQIKNILTFKYYILQYINRIILHIIIKIGFLRSISPVVNGVPELWLLAL